jgi:hypothetical protein
MSPRVIKKTELFNQPIERLIEPFKKRCRIPPAWGLGVSPIPNKNPPRGETKSRGLKIAPAAPPSASSVEIAS